MQLYREAAHKAFSFFLWHMYKLNIEHDMTVKLHVAPFLKITGCIVFLLFGVCALFFLRNDTGSDASGFLAAGVIRGELAGALLHDLLLFR